MEIYLESKYTENLFCKFEKIGEDVKMTKVWNQYLYSEVCEKELINTSEVETRLQLSTYVDTVAAKWAERWEAVPSSKEVFINELHKALNNF